MVTMPRNEQVLWAARPNETASKVGKSNCEKKLHSPPYKRSSASYVRVYVYVLDLSDTVDTKIKGVQHCDGRIRCMGKPTALNTEPRQVPEVT